MSWGQRASCHIMLISPVLNTLPDAQEMLNKGTEAK